MRTLSGAITLVASALFFVADGLAHGGTKEVAIFIGEGVGVVGLALIFIGLATDKKPV